MIVTSGTMKALDINTSGILMLQRIQNIIEKVRSSEEEG